ncbi:MAG: hypothetical protein M3Q34_02805 [bacterium]|nr:hypothetical protein [bacterium]
MAKVTNKKNNVGKVLAVGAGVAALSAAAYVLFGPEGKNNRKKIQGWAVKMKGEIIERMEESKELTESVYNQIVDEVSAKYAVAKGVTKEEVQSVVGELRKHWKMLVRDTKPKVQGAKKKAVAKVKAVAKKLK